MSKLIYKVINEIMKDLPAISKERKLEINGRLQYKFRGIDDVYMALNPLLVKHKVMTVPNATVHTAERVATKNGEANRVILNVEYTFFAEDGSFVIAQAIGEGMDTGDKAANKAMSAAHKYALLQVFCIPTEEPKDSENDHHEIEGKSRDVEKKTGIQAKIDSKSQTNISMNTSQRTDIPAKEGNSDTMPENFVCELKKYKGKTIGEIIKIHGTQNLDNYCTWLKNNTTVQGHSADFIEAAQVAIDDYNGLEHSPPQETLEQKMTRL